MNKQNQQTTNGRTLSNDEINLIDKINNFSYTDLVGYGNIGAINGKVPVVLADKNPNPIVKEIPYNLEMASAKLQEATDKFHESNAKGNKALANYYESLIPLYGSIMRKCKNGSVTQKVAENWLGCYQSSANKVTLYLESINGNLSKLAGTYVHEMMHAYFATQNTVREIEEPITEYATLKFLKAFDEDLFKDYYREVCNKKSDQIAQFYGFGAYLFDATTTDWLCLYKERGSNLPTSVNMEHYLKLFLGQYPIDNEKDCAEMLERMLNGILVPVHIKKNANSVSAIESAVLNGSLMIPFAFDKKTNTMIINCDMHCEYHRDFERFISRLSHMEHVHKVRLVLGPEAELSESRNFHFIYNMMVEELVVAPNNKNYRIENDVLLSRDGKVALCPIKKRGKIIIPDGVERIADLAFINCHDIHEVVLPSSLRSTGKQSFCNCGIREITLPIGMETLEDHTFFFSAIQKIHISKTLTTVGRNVLTGCGNVRVYIDPANAQLDEITAKLAC